MILKKFSRTKKLGKNVQNTASFLQSWIITPILKKNVIFAEKC
jgi:hypothetical protein